MAAGLAYRRPAPGRRGLRDLPQPGLRPAPHGLRPAQGGGDRGARPGRCHRSRRRLAQRHVGHVDRGVVPGLHLAAPRDGEQVAGACARRSRSTTHRRSCASPRAASPSRSPRSASAAASTCSPSPTRGTPTSSSSGSARWPRRRSPPPRSSPPRGTASGSSTRCGRCPSPDAVVALARTAHRVAVVEDNVVVGGHRVAGRAEPARRRPGSWPVDHFGLPQALPRPRLARRGARRRRAHPRRHRLPAARPPRLSDRAVTSR